MFELVYIHHNIKLLTYSNLILLLISATAHFGFLHHQLRGTTFPDYIDHWVTTPVLEVKSKACYVLRPQHANSG